MASPISVFLITLNEAAHIEQVIRSVMDFDEVIVLDSGSTDGTVEIVTGLGVPVIHQPWLGYSAQTAAALAKCRNEWCLNVDGDEVVSQALAQELMAATERADITAVKLSINDVILGKPLHGWSRKRRIVRLFRRSRAKYPTDRTVHENLLIDGKVIAARHALHHFGYDDPVTYFAKQIKYAELRASDKFAKGKRGSLLKLGLVGPYTFFRTFLLGRLFLSGRAGLIISTAESVYAFCKEAHLLRLGQQANR